MSMKLKQPLEKKRIKKYEIIQKVIKRVQLVAKISLKIEDGKK